MPYREGQGKQGKQMSSQFPALPLEVAADLERTQQEQRVQRLTSRMPEELRRLNREGHLILKTWSVRTPIRTVVMRIIDGRESRLGRGVVVT